MPKVLKGPNKEKQTNRKLPKQVTLMIESKMLEEQTLKTELLSAKASAKMLTTQSSLEKFLKPQLHMNLSQQALVSALRPSTRSQRGNMTSRCSGSKTDHQDFPFQPRINSKSRSLSKNRELSQPRPCRHKKCTIQHDHHHEPTVNPASNFKYFEKLLYRVTSYFEDSRECWEFKQMTYGNVLTLLHRLGYIQSPSEHELFKGNHTESLKKAYQFWQYISNGMTATLENFFIIVCAIEKISISSQEIVKAVAMFVNYLCRKSTSFKMDTPEQPEFRFIVGRPSHAFGVQGEIILDRASQLKIPGEFKTFVVNRLNSQPDKSAAVAERMTNSITVTHISEKSSRLADKKRKKIIQIIKNRKPNVETVSLLDILNFKNKKVIYPTSPSLTQSTYLSQSAAQLPKRHHIKLSQNFLQNISKPKMVIQRSRDELDYERVQHQCTFQPQIHSLKKFPQQQVLKIRNADKSIQRIKQGRWFKKEKNKLIQSGWTNCTTARRGKQNKTTITFLKERRPSTGNTAVTTALREAVTTKNIMIEEKHQYEQSIEDHAAAKALQSDQVNNSSTAKCIQTLPTLKTEQKQLRIPLLFIDINIDETKKQRIVIYDQDNSQKLAEQFAKRHNLDADMQAKLCELLEYQMSSILTKIQQEADEDDHY